MLLALLGRKFVLPKLLELKLTNAVEHNKEILKKHYQQKEDQREHWIVT